MSTIQIAARPQPVNPRQMAAEYTNSTLGGIGEGGQTTALPSIRQPSMKGVSGLKQTTIQDRVKMIQESTSRQHQYMTQGYRAVNNRKALANGSGGGGYSLGPYQRTGGATSGPRGQHGLVPGAEQALANLQAAYRKQFGQNIPIASGGRTRQQQEYLYNLYRQGRGNLAAAPGTSVHEHGQAVDFGGPIQNAGSVQHRWLQQNAGKFGWLWTGKNFSQFEPWHWEWRG